MMALRSGSVS